MNEFLMSGLVLSGVVVGALLAWLLAGARRAAHIEAAVARSEAALQGEIVQLRERARAADEARQGGQAVFEALQRQADGWRNDLDLARDETARLTERVSRVPTLEAELARQAEQLRVGSADVLRLSSDAAQKGQAATLLTEQVLARERERDELSAQVRDVTEALERANEQLRQQLADLRESNGGEVARLVATREAHAEMRSAWIHEKAARAAAEADVARLGSELTEMRVMLDAERKGAAEKLQLLSQAREALTDQFKSLASDILEEKSKRFAEQNQASLGQLLDPLRHQLTEFKGKVEEVYVQEGKDRSALSEQVRQLVGLNQALSQDAKNLTLALKGSAKTQGNWGELVLERVLEASGLRKGHEYHVQESQQREDGSRAQADVVINLPEERRLVVDAKVSLVAYEAHVAAEHDDARALAVRRHLESVKSHIKGLSGKQYQTLYGLKSLDFVLMFVPIEPAFMMAVTHDNELFMDAWDKNVLLVSPSTLLFVVRTVAHLWRQEQQSRNSQDIAKRGAELYDRLVGFVEDLQQVGNRLGQAQTSYDAAFRKLTTTKGNVIRQAEMLRDLGVKPSKAMPGTVLDRTDPEAGIGLVAGHLAPVAVGNALHLATSDGAQLQAARPSEGVADPAPTG